MGVDIVIFSIICMVYAVSRETSAEVLTVVLASDEGDLEQCGCNGGDEKEWICDMLKVNLTVQQMGCVQ